MNGRPHRNSVGCEQPTESQCDENPPPNGPSGEPTQGTSTHDPQLAEFTEDEDSRGDSGKSIAFLQWAQPEGPWALTAIHPERIGTETMTFYPNEVENARKWLEERIGVKNLYFHLNEVGGRLKKKASKEDMKAARWLHVDVDPRKDHAIPIEQARILAALHNPPEGIPAPTLITFSGGGYQAFWKLEYPFILDGNIERAAELERFNKTLEQAFGGDNCHNVDRIMRLPYTVNVPDPKKRAKGRKVALARVVEVHKDRVYPLGEFKAAPEVQKQEKGGRLLGEREPIQISGNIPRLTDMDMLNEWKVPERIKALISSGHLRDIEGPKRGDDSRSGWLFDCICGLVRAGVPAELIYGIITDKEWAIAESVIDKGRTMDRYARRQISRAKEEAEAFATNEKGTPICSQRNIRLALAKLDVEVRHDQFADRLTIRGLPDYGPHLSDAAMIRLWLEVEDQFGFRPNKDFFFNVVEDQARRDGFHPVLDYLSGLQWDGVKRLDTWLIRHAQAEDTPYTRTVSALVLIAAVRRVRQPGCKFDEMLILESDQGLDKSSALQVLAVKEEWFTDDLPLNVDSKIFIERTRGHWIIEAGELKGMRKGDVEHLKNLLSRRADKARLAYGRLRDEVPRQSIMIGTTNWQRYLRDPTGNRRFWPVRVGPFNVAALAAERDQLWAEAAVREASGTSIRLDPRLYGHAAAAQSERQTEDPWRLRLEDVLGDLSGKLLAEDAWRIVGKPVGQRTQDDNERFGQAMRALGFERTKRRFGSAPQNAYVRGSTYEAQDVRIIVAPDGSRASPANESQPF